MKQLLILRSQLQSFSVGLNVLYNLVDVVSCHFVGTGIDLYDFCWILSCLDRIELAVVL